MPPMFLKSETVNGCFLTIALSNPRDLSFIIEVGEMGRKCATGVYEKFTES